ncbi:MAG: hypothetical protein QXG48_03890 [Thermofilaceae archaeon]
MSKERMDELRRFYVKVLREIPVEVGRLPAWVPEARIDMDVVVVERGRVWLRRAFDSFAYAFYTSRPELILKSLWALGVKRALLIYGGRREVVNLERLAKIKP